MARLLAMRRIVLAMAAMASALTVSAQTITEFNVPTATSNPVDITAGPDGNIWFTENLAGRIGRITPGGTITEFLNDPNAGPAGIIAGPDGNLWYADQYANEIGRVTTSGAVTRFPVGDPNIFPVGIAAGSDGNLWFAEYGPQPEEGSFDSTGGKIGRITTSGAITQFPLPPFVAPVVIRAGPDGNLWFTDPGTNTIGRMTTSGALTSFTVPTAAAGPVGLTVGPDGALWFTEALAHKIGRITTAGAFTEFPVSTAEISPLGISKGPDGNLWFTDNTNNTIGRMTTSGAVTMFPIPTAASGPVQITQGPDGNLWFTEIASNKIGKVTLGAGGSCVTDATTFCAGGRFKVQTQYTTASRTAGEVRLDSPSATGPGQAVALTSDTGYFWFFSPNNVELVIKVVDGRAVNNRFWVFAAGLTNVNVVITVTDTQTGAIKTYTNPQGVAFLPIQDTSAFSSTIEIESAARTPRGKDPAPPPERFASAPGPEAALAVCSPDATTLCLNGGRFQVRTRWNTTDGASGDGQSVALTGDTGYFWFFSSNNVEMVVKAVTGCPVNNRYWVFAGGLTNVNVVMTVTDTQTGAVKTYINPQGTAFQPTQDTNAFACP